MTTSSRPYVYIERIPSPADDPDAYNLDVKAGNGVDTREEIVRMLLVVVEEVTGVSSDLYAQEIEIAHRAALSGLPTPAHLDHEEGA